MNKTEMVSIISKQRGLDPPEVDDVLRSFLELVLQNLSVGEPVTIRGFGRFDPKTRPSVNLKHPRTGAVIETGERRTISFRPSRSAKTTLNPDAPSTTPKPRAKYMRRDGRRGWKHLPSDVVHRYLWRHTDERNRVKIDLKTMAADLDMHYSTAHNQRDRLVEQGKLRKVGVVESRGIFEVTCPDGAGDERGADLVPEARPARVLRWA